MFYKNTIIRLYHYIFLVNLYWTITLGKMNIWLFIRNKKNCSILPLIILFTIVFLFSCSKKTKSAQYYLNVARDSYDKGHYDKAKSNVDSIKLLFPKAFKEIREGFDLMQVIRTAENERNIVFIDSMIDVNVSRLKELQVNFDFVRDENYQEFGNYIPKITPISETLNQNTLRSGVSEKGILFLESVLSGSNLNHNQIKVSIPDNSYAESHKVTADGLNYRFTTLNKTYEIVRFIGSDDNGVAEFINVFQNHPITLSFIGNRSLNITLSAIAKKAISQSFELSTVLLELESLKFEKGKSESLLRYLEERRNKIK